MGIGTRLLALSLAGALVAPMMASASVYRCTVDGATVFSDRPCGADQSEVEIRTQSPSGMRLDQGADVEFYRPPARQQRPESNCRYINTTELRTLIARNQITPGMKPEDVRRSWGSPSSVSTGRVTQWAYHYPNYSASYVYFENGCVTDWSGYYR